MGACAAAERLATSSSGVGVGVGSGSSSATNAPDSRVRLSHPGDPPARGFAPAGIDAVEEDAAGEELERRVELEGVGRCVLGTGDEPRRVIEELVVGQVGGDRCRGHAHGGTLRPKANLRSSVSFGRSASTLIQRADDDRRGRRAHRRGRLRRCASTTPRDSSPRSGAPAASAGSRVRCCAGSHSSASRRPSA